MKFTTQATDDAVRVELGTRLARTRLDRNLTQAGLAVQAGVSKRTVERLEAGSVAPHLSAFIRVCRALDAIERFELLFPPAAPSPLVQLKLRGKTRQRASSKKPAAPAPGTWTWGDAE